MRRLLRYARPYRALVIGSLVLLVADGTLQLVGPALTQRVIDVAIPRGDTRLVVTSALLFAATLAFQFVFTYGETMLTSLLWPARHARSARRDLRAFAATLDLVLRSQSSHNTDGPVLSEIFFVFPSRGAAKKFMATAAKQVDKCTASWSVTRIPGDTPYVWTIKPRKISPLGDQRFASRQITSSAPDDITRDPDLPDVSEDAVVRVGNKVLLLSRSGISEAVDLNKTGFVDDLDKVAVRKLKNARAVSTSPSSTRNSSMPRTHMCPWPFARRARTDRQVTSGGASLARPSFSRARRAALWTPYR